MYVFHAPCRWLTVACSCTCNFWIALPGSFDTVNAKNAFLVSDGTKTLNNKMLSCEFSSSQFIENQMRGTLGVQKVSSRWEHHEDFVVENMRSQIDPNHSVQQECEKKHDGCHDERHLEDGTLYGRREYHQGQLCCLRNWKWVLLQGLWRLP
jgi:hypothetical protein